MKSITIVAIILLLFLTSCGPAPQPAEKAAEPAPAPPPANVGPLGEMAIPADNPMTPERIALGKQLFFDKRLSKSGNTSCETCHVPEKGWTDGEVLSKK